MLNTTLSLIVFLFPLAYSPGPGNMFFAAIGARFGTVASLPASAGYHAATWIVTLAIGAGFAGLASTGPAAFTVLKYAGSAYVLWLGWTFLRAGASDARTEPRRAGVIDGAALLVLNPKAYVIIALMFTQFLPQGAPDYPKLLVLITTVFTLNNLLAFLVWTVLGDALARMFRSQAQARALNVVFGAMLVGVALWMLLR